MVHILLEQLAAMAIYSLIGFLLHKKTMIGPDGCAAFSTLLLYVILPCVILSSFMREAAAETSKMLVLSIALAAMLLALAMIISKLLFRKNPIMEFSSSFSNAGFMGLPLIESILGEEAIIYSVGFIALLNILQWTYGLHLMMPSEKVCIKSVMKNPLVVAFIIGITLYLLPWELPTVITTSISAVAKCNSPIAMIILGYYLYEIKFSHIVTNMKMYLVSVSRLLIIPLLSVTLLYFMPGLSTTFKLSLVMVLSCPVGINVAIYAKKAEVDYHSAAVAVCQSTILSLATLPIIIFIAHVLF